MLLYDRLSLSYLLQFSHNITADLDLKVFNHHNVNAYRQHNIFNIQFII